MVHSEHATKMLASANADWEAARVLADHEEISDSIVGFHLQQAVEKGLKSALIATNTPYPRTHNLSTLFRLLRNQAPAFDAFQDLEDLSDYAVTIRYGFETQWWGSDELQQILVQVSEMLGRVQQYLLSVDETS